jgi:L-rhamnose isomerase/sugar isomerase
VELVDGEDASIQLAEDRPAAFGAEIEREILAGRVISSSSPHDNIMLTDAHIQEHNRAGARTLAEDFEHLTRQLARRNIDAEALVTRAAQFRVTVPSWGVGGGGTRFGRFGFAGEPRNILEKLEDCEAVLRLVRVTPGISLHIPWDKPENAPQLRACAEAKGLFIDSMNSNTFQDQPGQAHSYQFGSLSHTDRFVRQQAVAHNQECIQIGQQLGARSHTVWIGDGGNFPGQVHFRRALDRYLESLREIYRAVPETWRLFLEHKFYEPAFYSTVLNDWGTSYYCARELGPRAWSLVDLGHHAPNVNVEMIVARLIQFGKLGGFHFNDSQYGDDDLDAGSMKPFQLFLIFNELVDAGLSAVPAFDPAYMLDQSHNVTDPIESLVTSSVELTRAYVQAHLVDRSALAQFQDRNDALMALQTLKQAFTTDVGPILATARVRHGGAADPIAAYRSSGYRQARAAER